MFNFNVYSRHGNGWRRLPNIQADNYIQAARIAKGSSGIRTIKVIGEDRAAMASMGYRDRVVNFTQSGSTL